MISHKKIKQWSQIMWNINNTNILSSVSINIFETPWLKFQELKEELKIYNL